jgi:hypothetical protein
MVGPKLFVKKCAAGYTVQNQQGQAAWEGTWWENSNVQERKSRKTCMVEPVIFSQPEWAQGWIYCGCPGGLWPFVVFAHSHDDALEQVATKTAYDVLAGRPLYPEIQQMMWTDFWRSTGEKAEWLYLQTSSTLVIEYSWPDEEEVKRRIDEEKEQANSKQAVYPLQKRDTTLAVKKISALIKKHLGEYQYQQGFHEQGALMERDPDAKEAHIKLARTNATKSEALSHLLAEIDSSWDKW